MKDEGANGKNKETFPSKRGTSRRASRFFVGRRDDERKQRDAPKRTCEDRVNSRETSRTRYARISSFLFFAFTPSPSFVSHSHTTRYGWRLFPRKRFTFGTELHGCCSVCSEKEILHKTMENTKVNETVKEKDKTLHP